MAVILASQSPRRRELLSRVVSDFEVAPADIDEDVHGYEEPKEYVLAMAAQKAQQISEKYPNDLIIACDTIVTIDNEILGKPTSREDAFQMLKKLNNKTHIVYTSIALMKGAKKTSATVSATVSFYELTDDEINQYLDTGEYLDKAGAYGIQGQGALLVEQIFGDYYSIVGLPLGKLSRMLKAFD